MELSRFGGGSILHKGDVFPMPWAYGLPTFTDAFHRGCLTQIRHNERPFIVSPDIVRLADVVSVADRSLRAQRCGLLDRS